MGTEIVKCALCNEPCIIKSPGLTAICAKCLDSLYDWIMSIPNSEEEGVSSYTKGEIVTK